MAILLVSYAHCVENKGEGTSEGGGWYTVHLQKGNVPLPALPGKEGVAAVGSLR